MFFVVGDMILLLLIFFLYPKFRKWIFREYTPTHSFFEVADFLSVSVKCRLSQYLLCGPPSLFAMRIHGLQIHKEGHALMLAFTDVDICIAEGFLAKVAPIIFLIQPLNLGISFETFRCCFWRHECRSEVDSVANKWCGSGL